MNDAPSGADRPAFRRWLLGTARPYVAWVLIALGALAIFLGWYGVSGQSLTAKQLPYLVSGGLTGIALIVVAAALLVTDGVRREVGRLADIERKVDDLYALLVLDAPPAEAPPADTSPTDAPAGGETSEVVALPTGASYHRPGCALIAGKPAAVPVDERAIESRGLRPCAVCEPVSGAVAATSART
jgi:hypothetical protein